MYKCAIIGVGPNRARGLAEAYQHIERGQLLKEYCFRGIFSQQDLHQVVDQAKSSPPKTSATNYGATDKVDACEVEPDEWREQERSSLRAEVEPTAKPTQFARGEVCSQPRDFAGGLVICNGESYSASSSRDKHRRPLSIQPRNQRRNLLLPQSKSSPNC